MNETEARLRLEALHREVDDLAARLTATLPGVLVCRAGCRDCCLDDLTVLPVEADLIRYYHGALLATAAPHPVGACAFLGPDDRCRIYDQRPYVCRTQGLPLRWRDVDESGAEVELRDICPLNEEPLGTPLAALQPEQCWELGTFEGSLASLQAESQGGFELRRESLRRLFTARAP